MLRAVAAAVLVGAMGWGGHARGAELPAHEPLRILVVSDGVNPHGLAPSDLTEPGEVGAALNDVASSGINLAEPVVEVDSQCIDDALARLAGATPPDVVVYFAHAAAKGCDGSDQQAALTAAVAAHLARGGGVVGFHHGLFAAPGKEDLLALLGGEADQARWAPADGQDVICVRGGHFVTAWKIMYEGVRSFGIDGVVADGTYEYFANAPDERYLTYALHEVPDEVRIPLWGTSSADQPRLLGYALQRPGWRGWVITYQPGEYQPAALDDKTGNNFQILVNSIYWSVNAGQATDPDPPPEAGPDVAPPEDGDAAPVTKDGCAGAAGSSPVWWLVGLLGLLWLRPRTRAVG